MSTHPRICYIPIRFRAVAKGIPVHFATRLPDYVKRIVGVRPVHGIGMESTVSIGPRGASDRLGWLNLEANSKRHPLGQFDMFYDVFYPYYTDDANYDYQDVSVDVERDALITGFYYQEKDCVPLGANMTIEQALYAAPGVILSVYLKCERE